MAITYISTTIVCDAGPNNIPGPVDIIGIQCAGACSISKSGNTFLTFTSGTYKFDIRSASGLTITGACTLILRLAPHL